MNDKLKHQLTPVKVVFLYNSLSPHVIRYLENALREYPVDLIIPKNIDFESMRPLVSKADVLIGWKCSTELLTHARNLRLYITPYTGISYLIKAFRKLEVPLTCPIVNAHGAASLIAQHAVALLFGILNHLVVHHLEMIAGKWVPGGEGIEEPYPSIPIGGRKIGLLGYGSVNRQVHSMLSGFPVEFHALRRDWSKSDSLPLDGPSSKAPQLPPITKYNPDELEAFMTTIDTLIIAAPITKETREMITMDHLKLLGPQGVVVNVGRGKIIRENDLFNALQTKIINRAALDVWYVYNPDPDQFGRLWPYSEAFNTLPNVLLSPHRADSPFDDLRRWDDVILNIKKVVEGKDDYLHIVNLEAGY
ncbi:MAG: NAD(P)-dependent oxidoreductase [Promethearchaeota archaeon]